MPYVIKMRAGKHCVHKEGVSTPVLGGCHASHAEAERHRRALYAAEGTAMSSHRASIAAVESTTQTPLLWVPLGNLASAVTVTVSETADSADEQVDEEHRVRWEGVLGLEGHPTDDGRYVMPGQVGERDLPVPFFVQTRTADGHEGAEVCGRIEAVEHIPLGEFERAEEFELADVREDAIIIWGEGTLDGSEYAEDAERMIENGADVSIDGLHATGQLLDAETFEEVDTSELDFGEMLDALFGGKYLRALAGDIAGATVVGIGAFREARVGLVASALRIVRDKMLTASAAPLKPSREWFLDPGLRQLTPLTITGEGRIFGHLADWKGCYVGSPRICIGPFRSGSDYAYFNTGEIETAEGDLVPCGKLMFCREGGKHAPVNAWISWQEASRHYDDATKVGAFVRAGADRFGTWLAGSLRPDLSEAEVQHLRTHPPSGDWRPIPGRGTELIAAFSVAVPGFPIPRALVASAGDDVILISAPVTALTPSRIELWERRRTLKERAAVALGGEIDG